MKTAIVTGASRGLGRAVARALISGGWTVIADARDGAALHAALGERAILIPGDITDPEHRDALAGAADGRLDLLVNNAGGLGPSPLPNVKDLAPGDLRALLEVNTVAPLALTTLLWPSLAAVGGTIVNISSDAAVEAYPGWGGYGATKAALDRLTLVLAAESPEVRAYAFDPGDMRTVMHQDAYPSEDISDRPEPETIVPALLHLIASQPASGRYRASELMPVGVS